MLKKQVFGLVFSLASVLTLAGSLHAFQPVSDVSLTAGWRQDEIKNTISSSFATGEMKLKDLNTWEFGVRGQFAFPESCGCEDFWLDGLYVKGSALWGWGDDGKATFGVSGNGSGYDSGDSFDVGVSFKAHNTRTYDYTLGLGWMYAIDCNWGIGPTVGYAWDKLSTKVKNRGFNSGSDYSSSSYSDESYAGTTGNLFEYTQKWHGPWLGFEIAYEDCEWHFDLGYEFHWATHTAEFNSGNNNDYSYDNGSATNSSRKNHSRYGNVVYIDGWYDFCECWEVGVGFKYSCFETKSQHSSSSGHSDGESYSYSGDSYASNGLKGKSRWSAWGFTVDLGYRF